MRSSFKTFIFFTFLLFYAFALNLKLPCRIRRNLALRTLISLYVVSLHSTLLNIVSIVKQLFDHSLGLFCVPPYMQISAARCGLKALCMLKLRDDATST
jgi:hypothetical protein